ncbi:MAG: hypothetical protein ACRBK7_29675 [Acidimicrobiales bacterium]
MKKKLASTALAAALALTTLGAAPSDAVEESVAKIERETLTTLNLRFDRLPPLAESLVYEGWVIIDGVPETSGRFNVDTRGRFIDENGNFIPKTVDFPDNPEIDAFVLTIEPAVGDDPAPADTHILAGDFQRNGRATLKVEHPAAFGQDFSDASGSYILATPSNGNGDPLDERSGVWFLDPAEGTPTLDLPDLPPGWEYEGWAVIDGTPVTTGKFTTATGPDGFNGFSGDQPTPPFPGEDFLFNPPAGLTFPLDLRGETIAITVEPSPDDSPAPFPIEPLFGRVPNQLDDHELAELNRSLPNPKGRAWITTRRA